MTREQFIATPPMKYGNGRVNLLISSSIVDPVTDLTPLPPYEIQGLSVPDRSKEGINIAAALREVNALRLDFTEGQLSLRITGRRKKNGYFYYLVDPISVNTYPTSFGPSSEPIVEDSNFVFVPYVQSSFNNSDYNPLINNSVGSKVNSTTQVVDRFASQATPTNMTAILNQKAEPAEIQNDAYTKIGYVNSRYNGTKLTSARTVTEPNKHKFTDKTISGSVSGNEPALGFRSIEGSIHPIDSQNTTIRELSERELVDVYFNTILLFSPPSGSTVSVWNYPNYPDNNNFLYTSEGNKMNRVVNSKVYSTNNNTIYTVNEAGNVNEKQISFQLPITASYYLSSSYGGSRP
jgi:hypothetical protein